MCKKMKIKLLMNVFLLQKILAVSKTTINECPCGCETGLDDNHEAHSYSTVSLIKGIVYLRSTFFVKSQHS